MPQNSSFVIDGGGFYVNTSVETWYIRNTVVRKLPNL